MEEKTQQKPRQRRKVKFQGTEEEIPENGGDFKEPDPNSHLDSSQQKQQADDKVPVPCSSQSLPFYLLPRGSVDVYLTMKLVFGVFFAFSTNFVPDEFWQSTEVAYYLTHKRGHLTWEWHEGIRSYLVPSCIAAFYTLAKAIHILEGSQLLVI